MTPTWATGSPDRRRSRAGFTLVELLMTVAIIGLAAGAVVVSMPDPRPSVADESERFAARLQKAREEAILANQTVAVEVTGQGYDFSRFDGAEWSALNEGPFKTEIWAEGLTVSPIDPPLRVVFDPTGAAEPAELTLSRDSQSMRVAVDGAGEVLVR